MTMKKSKANEFLKRGKMKIIEVEYLINLNFQLRRVKTMLFCFRLSKLIVQQVQIVERRSPVWTRFQRRIGIQFQQQVRFILIE